MKSRSERQAGQASIRWERMRLAWQVTGSMDITRWPPATSTSTSSSSSGSSSDGDGALLPLRPARERAGPSSSSDDADEEDGPTGTKALAAEMDRLSAAEGDTVSRLASSPDDFTPVPLSSSGNDNNIGSTDAGGSLSPSPSPSSSGSASASSASSHSSAEGETIAHAATSRTRRAGRLALEDSLLSSGSSAGSAVEHSRGPEHGGAEEEDVRLNAGDLSDEEMTILAHTLNDRRRMRKTRRPRVFVDAIKSSLVNEPDEPIKLTKPLPLSAMVDIMISVWEETGVV